MQQGSILNFLAKPKPAQKKPKKKKPAQKEPPAVIDLCSESDVAIVQVKPPRKRLRLSPDLDLFDQEAAEPCPEREPSPPWPEFELEGAIGGLGLEGAHNPDFDNDEQWRQLDQEEADDASDESDDVILLHGNPTKEPTPEASTSHLKSLTQISSNFTPPKRVHAPAKGEPPRPTAFTALMTGHAEDKAWKQAAKSEKKGMRVKRGQYRAAPFYKILEGMPIAVDGFRYGAIPHIKAYFLSHAHSDHYQLLSSSWKAGPIYCSKTTANLIIMNLGVKPEFVHSMAFDETIDVCGIKVTMMDANHCPGSSIFLFEGPQSLPGSPYANSGKIFRYLHCGDFRASPKHLLHPAMAGKKIDICYLDTTYCAPSYQFPAQEQVIQACADLIKSRIQGDASALMRGQANAGDFVKAEQVFKGWLTNMAKKEEAEPNVPVQGSSKGMDLEPSDGSQFSKGAAQQAKKEIEDAVKRIKVADGDGKKRTREHILVLVGTYSIGKERIVKAIAQAINSKIYCGQHKYKLLECIDEDPELRGMLTRDPLDAQVHITGLFAINRENLGDYLDSFKGHFTKIIGLRPTGWSFKGEGSSAKNQSPPVAHVIANQRDKNYSSTFLYPQRDSTERLQAFGVPYSEHSSFRELTCFCVSMDHVRIIGMTSLRAALCGNRAAATVNVHSEVSRAKMKAWFEKWQAERKRRRQAGEPAMVRVPFFAASPPSHRRQVPYRDINYW